MFYKAIHAPDAMPKQRKGSHGRGAQKLVARVLTKWPEIIPVCGIIVVKRKNTAELAVIFLEMVDSKGIEPSTLRMRTNQSV